MNIQYYILLICSIIFIVKRLKNLSQNGTILKKTKYTLILKNDWTIKTTDNLNDALFIFDQLNYTFNIELIIKFIITNWMGLSDDKLKVDWMMINLRMHWDIWCHIHYNINWYGLIHRQYAFSKRGLYLNN